MRTTQAKFPNVFLFLDTTLLVCGNPTKALVDRSATVSVINKRLVGMRKYCGRAVSIKGYDMVSSTLSGREGSAAETPAVTLSIGDAKYGFLLSRPGTEAMQCNIYWNDPILVDRWDYAR